jgi:hypothetical protein
MMMKLKGVQGYPPGKIVPIRGDGIPLFTREIPILPPPPSCISGTSMGLPYYE